MSTLKTKLALFALRANLYYPNLSLKHPFCHLHSLTFKFFPKVPANRLLGAFPNTIAVSNIKLPFDLAPISFVYIRFCVASSVSNIS